MTDLFRGYDLTTVVEKVAESEYNRGREAARADFPDEVDKEFSEWGVLSPHVKHTFKSNLLPIVTAVLEALESDQVKPTEGKQMFEYEFKSHDDPKLYENRPAMHDKTKCFVWALHMNVHPSALPAMLERASVLDETTGEYTYGDSWTEWGEVTDDDANRHLVIYFDAPPARAKQVGDHIAISLTTAAVRAMGGDSGPIPGYDVSTSGDYAEIIKE